MFFCVCVCVQGSHIRRNNLEQYTFFIQEKHVFAKFAKQSKIQKSQNSKPWSREVALFGFFGFLEVFLVYFGKIIYKKKKTCVFLDLTLRGVENQKSTRVFLDFE